MKNEIIEGNKLIAEFLECDYAHGFFATTQDYFPDDKLTHTPDELEYHSSWDWLMPVVEKIENITVKGKQWTVIEDESDVDWSFEFCIESKQCTVNRCAYDGDEKDFLSLYDCRNYNKLSKIEAVYLAVVEFIKWYNQTKS